MPCPKRFQALDISLEDVHLQLAAHTLNPVPLMGWGDGARDLLAAVRGLDEVAPAIVARHR